MPQAAAPAQPVPPAPPAAATPEPPEPPTPPAPEPEKPKAIDLQYAILEEAPKVDGGCNVVIESMTAATKDKAEEAAFEKLMQKRLKEYDALDEDAQKDADPPGVDALLAIPVTRFKFTQYEAEVETTVNIKKKGS
jgi:hypothetical protein